MGLFDQILGSVLSGAGGQAPGTANAGMTGAGFPGAGSGTGALPQILLAAIAHEGGISGLMQKFQSAGMGDTFASWVGTGTNQPVTPAALQQVLDPATVQEISRRTGLSTDQLLGQASQHLPQMVDGLTPNGQVPASSNALLQAGLALLKSRYGIA